MSADVQNNNNNNNNNNEQKWDNKYAPGPQSIATDAKMKEEVQKLKEQLQAEADNLPYAVPCCCQTEYISPCKRFTFKYSISFIKKYGIPNWNCLHDGYQSHCCPKRPKRNDN